MKPLSIIGIDPGTTSAYVVLSLDGNILKTHSGKELVLADMIREVMEVSSPLIVGTDKARIPGMVEEFARKVGTLIAAPEQDAKREDKRMLLHDYVVSEDMKLNDHQQDCLAAALFAFRKYAPRLHKIDRFIREQNMESRREEFTRMALREDMHFSRIKDLLTKERVEHRIMQDVIRENKITKHNFLTLYAKLAEVQREKMILERKMTLLRQQVHEAQKTKTVFERKSMNMSTRIDALFRFKEERLHLQQRELEEKQYIVQELQKERQRLYHFITSVPEYQLVKKLETLSQHEYLRKKALLRIKENDVVLVGKPEIHSENVLKELRERGIILLSRHTFPSVLGRSFLTTQIHDNEIASENAYFALVERAIIEERMKEKDLLQNVIEEYREGRAKQV